MNSTGSRVSLYFRCENLADADTFSKSDPYIVLRRISGNQQFEVGRTEIVPNNLNPSFNKSIEVDYLFESKQEFVLKIYDDDGHKRDEDNDALGDVTFTLAHVMCSKGHSKEFFIAPPYRGKVIVTAVDHSTTGDDTISLEFYGRNMRKMDLFSDSDPFFKLWRVLPNNQKQLLYQSEVIDDDLNPNWKPLPVFRVAALTGRDTSAKTLLFECFDDDLIGCKGMGSFTFSVDELLQTYADPVNHSFELRKDHKKENHYGNVYVKRCEITRCVTFADLLARGWQINLACAIDFTASNGEPRDPRSLHFLANGCNNQYSMAIQSAGDVLLDYDTDKMVAAYGFGAKLPDGTVSHNFHLNLQPNPYVYGLTGILDAYRQSLFTVRLCGPTNFAPTIRNVTAGAMKAELDHIYTILLIITDGEISDIDDTIDALVKADDVALSIIIVGVGSDCDFEAMKQLDGDDGALVSCGRKSRRDLVQFVPMKQFVNLPKAELAAELLREIPAQVERWASIKGFRK